MLVHLLTSLFDDLALLVYPSTAFLVLAVIVVIFHEKILSIALLCLGILYFFFSACGIIPQLLTNRLEKQISPVSIHNIITHRAMLVLGGGISHYPNVTTLEMTSFPRVLEAYRIYKIAEQHHIHYTLFLSGGDVNHRNISEAALYKKLLLQLGVPAHYLIIENRSRNTYENARNLKNIINHYPFKNYLLVTSALHMKRAQYYLNHFDIKTIAAPSDFPYPIRTLLPLEYNLVLQELALHEYIGIFRFNLYNALGLNH